MSRALVTGGTSGIGAATARLLLERGWQVGVLARRAEGAPEGVVAVVADVADSVEVRRAVDEVAGALGGLDLLVNNAGTTAGGTFEQIDDDEWQRVLDVNLLGVVRVTRAALPHLRRSQAAAIVNVGSFLAETGLPRRTAYSASKGAVHALTRSLAAELVGSGITVNAVSPGSVDTPWIDRLLEQADDPERERAALVARQPIGRLVTAEEVAEAILHLAGSRGTTGSVLAVDGGAGRLRVPPDPLRGQYATGRNLESRIALHARFSTAAHSWPAWLWERIGPLDGLRLLEVGCGTGRLWQANAAQVPAGLRLTLTDVSPGMMEEARRATAALPCAVEALVADAQALPFPDASFDAVLANHMLYHVPDRPRALRELRRVLAPAGRLLAATNGERHLGEVRALAVRYGVRPWSLGFTLENGGDQLAAVFGEVSLERYPNGLRVTEAEPVVAFARSMADGALLDVDGLRAEVSARIARDGALEVVSDAGLFTARV